MPGSKKLRRSDGLGGRQGERSQTNLPHNPPGKNARHFYRFDTREGQPPSDSGLRSDGIERESARQNRDIQTEPSIEALGKEYVGALKPPFKYSETRFDLDNVQNIQMYQETLADLQDLLKKPQMVVEEILPKMSQRVQDLQSYLKMQLKEQISLQEQQSMSQERLNQLKEEEKQLSIFQDILANPRATLLNRGKIEDMQRLIEAKKEQLIKKEQIEYRKEQLRKERWII